MSDAVLWDVQKSQNDAVGPFANTASTVIVIDNNNEQLLIIVVSAGPQIHTGRARL